MQANSLFSEHEVKHDKLSLEQCLQIATVVARELEKGKSIEDVRFLISLMIQQKVDSIAQSVSLDSKP